MARARATWFTRAWRPRGAPPPRPPEQPRRGGPDGGGDRVAEDVAPRPVSPYGWSKLQAEATVLAVRDRLHVTVLRPPVVYGPRDRGVLEVARWVARGLLPMPAGPSRTLSLCYVQDLVTALLDRGRGQEPVRRDLPRRRRRGPSRGSSSATPWARPSESTPPRCGSPCRFSSPSPPARTRGRGHGTTRVLLARQGPRGGRALALRHRQGAAAARRRPPRRAAGTARP